MEYEIEIGGIDHLTCGMYALESGTRQPFICFDHWEPFTHGLLVFLPGTEITSWHFVFEPETVTLQILNHEVLHWVIHKLEGYPITPKSMSDRLDALIQFVGREDQLGLPIREGERETE